MNVWFSIINILLLEVNVELSKVVVINNYCVLKVPNKRNIVLYTCII